MESTEILTPRKNRALPIITLILSILFSITYTAIIIHAKVGTDNRITAIIFIVCAVLGLLTVIFSLVTSKVNKIFDPMNERIEAIGGRYAILGIVCTIFPLLVTEFILYPFFPKFEDLYENHPAEVTLALTVFSIYIVGFPIMALLMRKVPKMTIKPQKLPFTSFLLFVSVMAGLCLIGTLIGAPIHYVLTTPFAEDSSGTSDIAELLMSSSIFSRTLVTGILAPIFEELLFRKLLIDRTIKYGETMSVILSGYAFGLFHGNFSQFFFASFVGMLFAYVYIRTGKLRYTIFMHMLVNLSTSIVTVTLLLKASPLLEGDDVDLESMDLTDMLTIMGFTGWIMLLFAIAVTGIILLIVFNKRFKLYKREGEPTTGKIISAFLSSPLAWSYIAICLASFGATYIPDILAAIINAL